MVHGVRNAVGPARKCMSGLRPLVISFEPQPVPIPRPVLEKFPLLRFAALEVHAFMLQERGRGHAAPHSAPAKAGYFVLGGGVMTPCWAPAEGAGAGAVLGDLTAAGCCAAAGVCSTLCALPAEVAATPAISA